MPTSWFIGLKGAVATTMQVDTLETLQANCLLSEDKGDNNEYYAVDVSTNAETFILAETQAKIAINPVECKAAIVTCDGLCPGLNTVIREVIMYLQQ